MFLRHLTEVAEQHAVAPRGPANTEFHERILSLERHKCQVTKADLLPVIHLPELDPAYRQWKLEAQKSAPKERYAGFVD